MLQVQKNYIFNHQCVQNWHSVTIDAEAKMFYPTNGKDYN